MLDASHDLVDLRIPGIEDTRRGLNALELGAGGEFHTVNAVRSGNKALRREADPDHPARDRPVPARGRDGSGRISLSQDPAVSLHMPAS